MIVFFYLYCHVVPASRPCWLLAKRLIDYMASKLSQSLATHTRLWYLLNAEGHASGRLAVVIAQLLQGKTKPIYHPAVDVGDHVIVINTRKIALSGNKWKQKLYRHHTGYPGGFREIVAERVHEKDPCNVLRKSVSGMLPRNHLRKMRMRRLHLFPDSEHPYEKNIHKALEGPCSTYRRLKDYTEKEIAEYPKLVEVPHFELPHYIKHDTP